LRTILPDDNPVEDVACGTVVMRGRLLRAAALLVACTPVAPLTGCGAHVGTIRSSSVCIECRSRRSCVADGLAVVRSWILAMPFTSACTDDASVLRSDCLLPEPHCHDFTETGYSFVADDVRVLRCGPYAGRSRLADALMDSPQNRDAVRLAIIAGVLSRDDVARAMRCSSDPRRELSPPDRAAWNRVAATLIDPSDRTSLVPPPEVDAR
jgi:hypothetical protein